jgi:hypothetical protein
MSREETEPYQVAQDALTVGAAIRPLEVRSFMMLYLIGGASSDMPAGPPAQLRRSRQMMLPFLTMMTPGSYERSRADSAQPLLPMTSIKCCY